MSFIEWSCNRGCMLSSCASLPLFLINSPPPPPPYLGNLPPPPLAGPGKGVCQCGGNCRCDKGCCVCSKCGEQSAHLTSLCSSSIPLHMSLTPCYLLSSSLPLSYSELHLHSCRVQVSWVCWKLLSLHVPGM